MQKISINKIPMKTIMLVLLSLVLIFSLYMIITFNKDKYDAKKVIETLINDHVKIEKTPDGKDKYIIDFDKLLKINPSVKGWIRYNKDKVNYPIVQASDNNYYLSHDFNKSDNQVGTIFMDHRNQSFDDKNVVLFGHNGPGDLMFGSLKDLLGNEYFGNADSDIIEIINVGNTSLYYEVFAVYNTYKEEYYISTDFNSDDDFLIFINTLKARSLIKFDVDLSKDDKILTLSTCVGYGDTEERLVVHARLWKTSEETNENENENQD